VRTGFSRTDLSLVKSFRMTERLTARLRVDSFNAFNPHEPEFSYFEGHRRYRPNERVYALHRNGYAGMQRFGSFLWSGGVQSTWETLKTHVPVAVNTGLSGIPF
jgi:alpha-glucosidase (family GH31 glycosyl hydrolase)